MSDFLRFFDKEQSIFPMHMEIYFSSIMDWCITVRAGRHGQGKDAKKIVDVQDCDMELAFAKAHVELKKWLLEHQGGY